MTKISCWGCEWWMLVRKMRRRGWFTKLAVVGMVCGLLAAAAAAGIKLGSGTKRDGGGASCKEFQVQVGSNYDGWMTGFRLLL